MASTSTTYDLLPGQREFLHVPPSVALDISCYQGGYGSGKTFSGVLRGLLLSQKYPGIRGLACAKTYPLLRDTTLQTYFEALDDLHFRDGQEFIWKASESKLIFPQWGGSEILFRHLEKPFKLKSLNLGWVHIEEMSEVEESIFMMLLSRLRQKKTPRHYLFGTTNPQANKGWIYKYFVDENKSNERIAYRRILAPSTQNIHLPPEYLENMKSQYDPEYYRINVMGEDGDYTAGLVVKNWSELNEVETPYRPELKIHITCDFNVDPMCWGLGHMYGTRPGEYEWHFFDELVEEYATTRECIDRFALRYPPDTVKGIEINGDSSGNQHRTEAQQYNHTNYNIMQTRLSELGYRSVKLNVRPANPYIMDRVPAFNSAVCNKEGVRRVFVNPKTCKWITYNMRNLMWKEGAAEIKKPTPTEIKNDPSSKFLGHPFDAVSYLVEKYDPVVLKVKREIEEQAPELIFEV